MKLSLSIVDADIFTREWQNQSTGSLLPVTEVVNLTRVGLKLSRFHSHKTCRIWLKTFPVITLIADLIIWFAFYCNGWSVLTIHTRDKVSRGDKAYSQIIRQQTNEPLLRWLRQCVGGAYISCMQCTVISKLSVMLPRSVVTMNPVCVQSIG